jgi:Txe/YoeB family toxin of toxin-antitoxin system
LILWTNRAQKDLDRLPKQLKERVEAVVADINDNPSAGTKLKGKLNGKWSARLGRAHRILYEIRNGDIVILTISPRRDAYR